MILKRYWLVHCLQAVAVGTLGRRSSRKSYRKVEKSIILSAPNEDSLRCIARILGPNNSIRRSTAKEDFEKTTKRGKHPWEELRNSYPHFLHMVDDNSVV